MKFFRGVGRGPRKDRLDFGGTHTHIHFPSSVWLAGDPPVFSEEPLKIVGAVDFSVWMLFLTPNHQLEYTEAELKD